MTPSTQALSLIFHPSPKLPEEFNQAFKVPPRDEWSHNLQESFMYLKIEKK